jgi:hypothetical protein
VLGLKTLNYQDYKMISEPIPQNNGTWTVKTSHGEKLFSDGETAEDFYLLNKHREQKNPHGNSTHPRQRP